MKKEIWSEYLLDISLFPSYCFVPYEKDTDSIVFGMNFIQEKSPGKLVGVIHSNGQEMVEEWCEQNPNWKTEYE